MEGPSQEDLNELLVFGYASKIYRDDERALSVENDGYLIPLLGDSSILIDRYDGRGALVDLKACEPLTQTPFISKEELQTEAWCDFERYRDCQDEDELENEVGSITNLNQNGVNDMENQEVIQMEKSRKYTRLPYSYDDSVLEDIDSSEKESKRKTRDYAYAPPPGLYLPPDLVLPRTMKSHAVIEKTAKFIASHGTQMEIILKTKQGSNSLFNFLTLNDELQPYYKYLVTAIKTHAYKPIPDHSRFETSPRGSDSEDEEHYLHPSLVPQTTTTSTDSKASLLSEYKVTGPSAYSMLVEKIQEMAPAVEDEEQVAAFGFPSGSEVGAGFNGNIGDWAVHRGDQSIESRSQPTGESLAIIEKMASYVAKNGPSFESLASTKGDPRFKFLHPSHPHHWYYVACKGSYAGTDTGGVVANKFVSYSNRSTTAEKASPEEPVLSGSVDIKVPSRPSAMPQKPPPPDHANALNRMASLPPALIDKIEQLRRKTLENRAKAAEEKPVAISWQAPVVTRLEVPVVQLPVPVIPQQVSLPVAANIAIELLPGEIEPETNAEKAEARRAERRKRAALFLEQMKKQMEDGDPPTASKTPPSLPSVPPALDTEGESREGNDVEIIGEVLHNETQRPRTLSAVESEKSDDSVEEIGRVSFKSRLQLLRKRAATDSDEEDDEPKKKRKRKKHSKSGSSSHEYDSSDHDRHHHQRSRSSTSRKNKKKTKKKKRRKDRKKSSSSSRKS